MICLHMVRRWCKVGTLQLCKGVWLVLRMSGQRTHSLIHEVRTWREGGTLRLCKGVWLIFEIPVRWIHGLIDWQYGDGQNEVHCDSSEWGAMRLFRIRCAATLQYLMRRDSSESGALRLCEGIWSVLELSGRRTHSLIGRQWGDGTSVSGGQMNEDPEVRARIEAESVDKGLLDFVEAWKDPSRDVWNYHLKRRGWEGRLGSWMGNLRSRSLGSVLSALTGDSCLLKSGGIRLGICENLIIRLGEKQLGLLTKVCWPSESGRIWLALRGIEACVEALIAMSRDEGDYHVRRRGWGMLHCTCARFDGASTWEAEICDGSITEVQSWGD